MAVRAAGVRLEHQLISKFLTDAHSADDAWAKNIKSVLAFAEAEKRATATILSAEKQRAAAATAESKERLAAAERNIQAEKRQTATLRAELQQQAAARRQAAQDARAAQRASSGAGGSFTERLSGAVTGGIGRSALGLGLGFLGVAGVSQALGTAVELDRMAAQSRTTNIALTELAGGSGQAAAAIDAIQKVAPGATGQLEAAGAAATILTQRLNSSAVGVDEIAKAIAIIPQLSPSIKSTGDALAQLTLFASSNAFARADQLLVTADEVKQRINDLQAAYPGLTDAQAKAGATVQLINERFKGVGDALAENVPGIQKLATAFEDLKLAIATGSIGPVDTAFSGLAEGLKFIQGQLDPSQTGVLQGGLQRRIESAREGVSPANSAIAGIFGIQDDATTASRLEQLAAVQKQVDEAFKAGVPNIQQYVIGVNELIQNAVLYGNVTDAEQEQLRQLHADFLLAAAGADEFAAAQKRQAEAQAAVAAATNLAELNEVRSQIDELTKSSLDLFAQGAPGADKLSGSLIELQTHLAGSTQLSEEDAAAVKEAARQHQLLAAAAGGSVGSLDAAAQAKLNDQVAALQDAQANQTLAASLQAVAAAQAGVARGVVSDLSGLIGSGLINAGQAGALNAQIGGQAAAGFAGIQGQGLTGPALSFATAQLEREITEPFRQLQQIEVDITREAQEQHRAAQGSGKAWNETNKAAQAAAKATLAALERVPGLFGASPVTQEQIDAANRGVPQNFADDFLRQLEDEVLNGVDRSGVSIEQGREALGRIGITAADDPKVVLQQLREAWENSSLFASKENLALINQQAVEDNLALQAKMEEGRKNVAELFGVAIDESVAAVGAGGVAPIDQEALQQRIQEAQQKFIDQMLMGLGVGPGGTSDAALASVVTGVGGGDAARGGLGGLQQSFTSATSTADILRGTFEGMTTTADILREAFGRTTESADVLATKVNDIPQVIWEDHIEEFPAWKEDIIDAFPGWDHWLGPEKGTAPPTDGTIPSSDDVGVTHPSVSDTVREQMTSPATSNTTNNRTTTVTIQTRQSTGSLVADWSILQAQGAV